MGAAAGVAGAREAIDDAGDGAGGEAGELRETAGGHAAVAFEQAEAFPVGNAHAEVSSDGRVEEDHGVAEFAVEGRFAGDRSGGFYVSLRHEILSCERSYIGMKRAGQGRVAAWRAGAAGAALAALLTGVAVRAGAQAGPGRGVRVQGPGREPRLFFACCDKGMVAAEKLLGNPAVVADLEQLHAGVVVALPAFTAQRALVQRLNEEGIPAVAGVQLPNDGTYFNDGDFPEAQAAVAAFEAWSERNGLRWEGVGLDIEPNYGELGRLRGHPWAMARLLAGRYFDWSRVFRARAEYAGLIGQLEGRGYEVQTYQLPFLVAEREERSTVLERMLGIVDVRGNEEALMLYTSFAPAGVGAGIIDVLGPKAQAIAVGSTEGPRGVALDWEEFSQELLVAAHFTPTVGVYNLEGCVEQGFLGRLETMDWGKVVVIPANEVKKARRREELACAGVWVGTWLPTLLAGLAGLAVVAGLVWPGRKRRTGS